jgi:hypothetical protein
MEKIRIRKSECADTRSCDWSKVSKQELLVDTFMHIEDVHKGMQFFADEINKASMKHDHTKVTNIAEFHNDFRTGFKTQDWYEMHKKVERHHFKGNDHIQDDVNLIDILEQIADGVMAGKARSGEYREEPLPKGLLEKAYKNTIKMLLDKVEVVK